MEDQQSSPRVGERAARTATDAAYVAVGASVLAFQRFQVERRALAKRVQAARLDGQALSAADRLATGVLDQLGTVDARVTAVEERVGATLDDWVPRLPEPARTLVDQARTVAGAARSSMRMPFSA